MKFSSDQLQHILQGIWSKKKAAEGMHLSPTGVVMSPELCQAFIYYLQLQLVSYKDPLDNKTKIFGLKVYRSTDMTGDYVEIIIKL